MSQTFRPLLRRWITRLILPLAVLITLAGYCAIHQLFFGAAVFLFFAAIAPLLSRPFIWQVELRLDGQGLSGRFGKDPVRVLWSDVVAARITHRGEPFLDLSSEKGWVGVPLDLFDNCAIWELVQRYVPPEALEADAYTRSPEYKVHLARVQSLLNDVREPLRAGYFTQGSFEEASLVIGWLFIVGLVLVWSWAEGIFCFGPLLLFFGKLNALFVFYRVEMTSEAVTVVDLGKRQVMRWDEVEYIGHYYWNRFVMYGNDKRLAVVGPQNLRGKDRPEMVEMLRAQIELRHIELRHEERALYARSRNVVVGRSA